jgi:hypothetical protein
VLASLLVALCGCDITSKTEEESATPSSSENYGAQVKALYEKAKGAGEQVPDDILEWAKADVKRIGTWDYKIISFSSDSDEEILSELQDLGKQRWECFWVETTPDGKRFYMKKAFRSYIQTAGKVSKFIPTPGAGE